MLSSRFLNVSMVFLSFSSFTFCSATTLFNSVCSASASFLSPIMILSLSFSSTLYFMLSLVSLLNLSILLMSLSLFSIFAISSSVTFVFLPMEYSIRVFISSMPISKKPLSWLNSAYITSICSLNFWLSSLTTSNSSFLTNGYVSRLSCPILKLPHFLLWLFWL